MNLDASESIEAGRISKEIKKLCSSGGLLLACHGVLLLIILSILLSKGFASS